MTILEEMHALRDSLNNESSTKRCAFEKLLVIEKVIRMLEKEQYYNNVTCDRCVLWNRMKESDDPGWGICHYNNTMPSTHETDWCYLGGQITNDQRSRGNKG